MLSGTCRRRMTREPDNDSGNHVRGAIGGTVYHPRHAPLERAGRACRGDHPDLREDRPPRRLPPHPRRPRNCRSRPSSSRAGRSPRPTSAPRASAGRRSRRPSPRSRRVTRAQLAEAYDRYVRPRARGGRRARAAPGSPAARGVAVTPRGGRRVRGDRGRVRPRPEVGHPARTARASDPTTAKGIVKVLGGELRIGLREGLVEAAIAQGVRPSARRRQVGRHARRRRRAAGRSSHATTSSATAELALFHPLKFMLASPAEDADEIIPGSARGLGRGQVRRDPRPAPQARARTCGCTRATCTTSAAQFPEVVDAAREAAVGRHPRRRDPGLAGRPVLPFIALQTRLGRKSPSAAIQAEVPVIYVAFDVLALGPARCAGGDRRTAPARTLTRAARTARCARPATRRATAAGSPARIWPGRDVDAARGRVRRRRAAGATRA